jgi:hypothetical protein
VVRPNGRAVAIDLDAAGAALVVVSVAPALIGPGGPLVRIRVGRHVFLGGMPASNISGRVTGNSSRLERFHRLRLGRFGLSTYSGRGWA